MGLFTSCTPSGLSQTTTFQTTNRITNSKLRKVSNHNKPRAKKQIVEVTGWIVDADGNIEFVARANQTKPKSPSQNSASCLVSQ